jgi:hypothetical protein
MEQVTSQAIKLEDPGPQLLKPAQVAKILSCSLPWVYKASESGMLPSVRIPCPGAGERRKTMVRFRMEDLLNFIEAHRTKSS